jgi:hypothetical protein
MSTINFPDANNAQSNSVYDLNRLVFETSNRTKRFFVYGVVTREEAARALNDYLSKKGVSFKPLFESDMSDAFVSCWRAHQIEVDRLKAHPEEIDDGTGEPGKISYVEEVFFTRVMKHIAQDTCELSCVRVLEFQSYTLIFGHRQVEFWAHESFAAEMAREVVVEDYLLESYNGGPLDDIKLRGLWLPTELFLDEKGNINKDKIFKDLTTKPPMSNIPIFHYMAAALFSQRRLVENMDFRFLCRFLSSFLQPIIPDWLVENRLYCIDFKDVDIEFYIYQRLDPEADVDESQKKAYPDLGMSRNEADEVVNKYAAEHNGAVTVIDYTRSSDCDPYVQADKFVDFLQKATGADGIKGGVDESTFMKILYFFVWIIKRIPNLSEKQLEEILVGATLGKVAEFLAKYAATKTNIPVVGLYRFISQVQFLDAHSKIWYDPNHYNPDRRYDEYPELPCISFECDFRGTLKNLFNV